MATPALIKFKAVRKKVRANTTRIVKNIDDLLADDETVTDDLEDQLSLLELKEKALLELDQQILDEMTSTTEDDPLIQTESNIAQEYQEEITLARNRVNRKIKKMKKAENGSAASDASDMSTLAEQFTNIKEESRLPTLTLQKFRGDITEWPGFWGQFRATIDQRTRLSKVERFNYLLSYLEGEPKEALSGLKISAENYSVAIKLLEERYDRKDLAIHTLMNKLLRLEPVASSNDIKGLRRLYDACESNLRSLKALDVDTLANGVSLCPVLVGLLPYDIRLKYSMNRKKEDEWKIDVLVSFLQREVEGRETCAMLRNENDPKHASKQEKPQQTSKAEYRSQERPYRSNWSSATALNTNVNQHQAQYQQKIYCIFCKSDTHATINCANYTIAEKKRVIQNSGRCFLCTRIGHDMKRCNSKFRECRICRGRHHAVVCENNRAHKTERNGGRDEKKPNQEDNLNQEESRRQSEKVTTALVRCPQPKRTVLLQTAMAITKSPNDPRRSQKVRCILDNCSQATFILEDVSRSLNLPVVGERNLEINNFGNQNPGVVKRKLVRVTIANTRKPEEAIELLAIEMPYLTTAVTLVNCEEVERYAKSRNMYLADEPSETTPPASSIGILIGADYYFEVATLNHERINGALVAVETKLGWTIQGPINSENVGVNNVLTRVMNVNVKLTESEIAKNLKSFWEIESLGITDSQEDPRENEVMERFQRDVIHKEGRYQVKFPWTVAKEKLPDNLSVATKRLRSLLVKFKVDPIFYQEYKTVVEEQLKMGIAEKVQGQEALPVGGAYYMPHQAVRKNDRSTTKLRVVFDASSRVKGARSLNDCLDRGPNLNPDILQLLLRFRTHRIAITADIEKAFLQVSLVEEERDFVRFLWVKEQNGRFLENQFDTLRMTRVPFGITSSPFLLAATIKTHIQKYTEEDKETVESLNENLYVDDYVGGAKTVQEALEFSRSAMRILKEANMNLRKWRTNSAELRDKWGEDETSAEAMTLEGSDTGNQKILGLLWEPNKDVFSFDLSNLAKIIQEAQSSKRGVLSAVAQIYDPLGMLSPYVVRAKFLFQQLWISGVKWDQQLPREVENLFEQWRNEMPTICQAKLPRCYYSEKEK